MSAWAPPGERARPGQADPVPLVIDLDGTLIRCDLLHETTVSLALSQPAALLSMPGWLAAGKARFKQEVAARVEIDAASLPYDAALRAWIRTERDSGRTIVLCTASDQKLAEQVAVECDLFDFVMASDGTTNLSARHKADALVARFGAKGFDYAGNSQADLPVWAVARRAIVVGAPRSVRAAAGRVAPVEREFAPQSASLRSWPKALRVHQWVKNLLVFLPLLGDHQFLNLPALMSAVLAFLAFSLCASSVYLVNDMADLASDRRHPRKHRRPFASGALSIPQGLLASALLIAAAFAIAFWGVNLAFTGWLALYLVATVCYSVWLKRKILVDSLVLAGLYTLRLLAGGAAADTPTGFWLLAFSLFLFFSLALVKRYSELFEIFRRGLTKTPGRDYVIEDLPLVEMLGIASGFCAVLVLALYINGDTVARLYPHQQMVWLTVPVLLYWVSRLWLKAHRGQLEDDPVVFAITDGVSRATILVFVLALLLASQK